MNFSFSSSVSPGPEAPGLLHRFVRIARPSVTTEALLIDVVDVHHVGRPGRIGEDPLLGRAQDGTGVDPFGSNARPLIVQWFEVKSKLKFRVTVGSPMSGSGTQGRRNRTGVGDVLSDPELQHGVTL